MRRWSPNVPLVDGNRNLLNVVGIVVCEPTLAKGIIRIFDFMDARLILWNEFRV